MTCSCMAMEHHIHILLCTSKSKFTEYYAEKEFLKSRNMFVNHIINHWGNRKGVLWPCFSFVFFFVGSNICILALVGSCGINKGLLEILLSKRSRVGLDALPMFADMVCKLIWKGKKHHQITWLKIGLKLLIDKFLIVVHVRLVHEV